jgi:hypothetical protein
LREEERTSKVNIQQFGELRFTGFCETGLDADAGVVDQKVEVLPLPVCLQCGANLPAKCGERPGVPTSSRSAAAWPPPIWAISNSVDPAQERRL